MLTKVWKRREKKNAVLKNGAKLLEERLVTAFGRDNPIKIFSATQIQQAMARYKESNPYQTDTPVDWGWSKGILDNRMVLIKAQYLSESSEPFRDIVVSSMMSSHSNVLKLLGCCLEFPVPVLVYENAEKGCLNLRGAIAEDGTVLSWKNRVKIAKEIASAVAYMHTSFPSRIIHRGIHPKNIYVNQDYSAKLTNFSLAISIPEGEPHIEDSVKAFVGFLDPAYLQTGLITEKTDVYSFGLLLLVFFTGKQGCDVSRSLHEGIFKEVVDPAIPGNAAGIEAELQTQLQAFVDLALSCAKLTSEDRPTMIEVAKELLRIERSISAP